jgi:hypothetical protein
MTHARSPLDASEAPIGSSYACDPLTDLFGFRADRQRLMRENAELRARLVALADVPILKHMPASEPDMLQLISTKMNMNSMLLVIDRTVERLQLFETVLVPLARDGRLRQLAPDASEVLQKLAFDVMCARRNAGDSVDMLRALVNCGRAAADSENEVTRLMRNMTDAQRGSAAR